MLAPEPSLPESFWEAWQEFLTSRDLAELETEELEGLLLGVCQGRVLRKLGQFPTESCRPAGDASEATRHWSADCRCLP